MQSIDRAVAILNVLCKREGGMSVSEISGIVGLSLGTTHRFLMSLSDNKLVTQNQDTKKYKLGLGILSLACGLLNTNRLLDVAHSHMLHTAIATDNMVFLCQEHNDEVICVSFANNPSGINAKFHAQVGSVMPFHASATAKLFFVNSSESSLRRLIAMHSPLDRYTSYTKCTFEEILDDYRQCRAAGYALCDEEMEPGVVAVGAPVFNHVGKMIASVGIIGIKANVVLKDFISAVVDCGRAISEDMGHAG